MTHTTEQAIFGTRASIYHRNMELDGVLEDALPSPKRSKELGSGGAYGSSWARHFAQRVKDKHAKECHIADIECTLNTIDVYTSEQRHHRRRLVTRDLQRAFDERVLKAGDALYIWIGQNDTVLTQQQFMEKTEDIVAWASAKNIRPVLIGMPYAHNNGPFNAIGRRHINQFDAVLRNVSATHYVAYVDVRKLQDEGHIHYRGDALNLTKQSFDYVIEEARKQHREQIILLRLLQHVSATSD